MFNAEKPSGGKQAAEKRFGKVTGETLTALAEQNEAVTKLLKMHAQQFADHKLDVITVDGATKAARALALMIDYVEAIDTAIAWEISSKRTRELREGLNRALGVDVKEVAEEAEATEGRRTTKVSRRRPRKKSV
jgi:F420-0:gamma-glutamyl ligase-like protein